MVSTKSIPLSQSDERTLASLSTKAEELARKSAFNTKESNELFNNWPTLWASMSTLLHKYRDQLTSNERFTSLGVQTSLEHATTPIWDLVNIMLRLPLNEPVCDQLPPLLVDSPDFLFFLVHSWIITIHMGSDFSHVGGAASRLFSALWDGAYGKKILDAFVAASPPLDGSYHISILCLTAIRREILVAEDAPAKAFDPSVLEFMLVIFERLAIHDDDFYRAALKHGSIELLSHVMKLLTSQKQKFVSGQREFMARYECLHACCMYFSACFQESPNWVSLALDNDILLSVVKCFPLLAQANTQLFPGFSWHLEEPAVLMLEIMYCYTKFFQSVTNRVTEAVRVIDSLDMKDEDNKLWHKWGPRLSTVWSDLAVEVTAKSSRIIREQFWETEFSKKACAYRVCKAEAVSVAKACSSCHTNYYCSKECQVADWKAGHREACRSIRSERLAGFPYPISTLDKAYSVWAATSVQVMKTPLVIKKLREYMRENPDTPNMQQMHATITYHNFPPKITVGPYNAELYPCKLPKANYICTVLIYGTQRKYTRPMPWEWKRLVDGTEPGVPRFEDDSSGSHDDDFDDSDASDEFDEVEDTSEGDSEEEAEDTSSEDD